MNFTTRPELSGTFGMVASTHWLASAAGMATLEQGGNAFDAAVAAGLVAAGRRAAPQRPRRRRADPPVRRRRAASRSSCAARARAGRGHDRRTSASSGWTSCRAPGCSRRCVPGAFDAWLLLLRDYGTLPLAEVHALRRSTTRSTASRCSPRIADDDRRGGAAVPRGVADRRPSSGSPGGRAPRAGRAVAQPRRSPRPGGGSSRTAEAAGPDRETQIAGGARRRFCAASSPRRSRTSSRAPR